MSKLSIIISMHNDKQYIGRCLDSIVRQTNKDYEVICVDDASTDETVDICRSYSDQLPLTVCVLDTNSGLSIVRQKGLDLSNGKYICFVDSDDELVPQYTDVAIREMDENGCDVCLFRVRYSSSLEENESPIHKEETKRISRELVESDFAGVVNECHLSDSWDKIYRKAFIDESKVTFRMDKGINGSDALFNKMLFLHNPVVSFISFVLYIHYANPNSMVTRPNKDFAQMAITSYTNLKKESEKLKYFSENCYNRLLFFSIIRKDLTGKVGDSERYQISLKKIMNFISLNKELKKPLSGNVSLLLFQWLICHFNLLLKAYLIFYKMAKK